jgi:hypothetical protein
VRRYADSSIGILYEEIASVGAFFWIATARRPVATRNANRARDVLQTSLETASQAFFPD